MPLYVRCQWLLYNIKKRSPYLFFVHWRPQQQKQQISYTVLLLFLVLTKDESLSAINKNMQIRQCSSAVFCSLLLCMFCWLTCDVGGMTVFSSFYGGYDCCSFSSGVFSVCPFFEELFHRSSG